MNPSAGRRAAHRLLRSRADVTTALGLVVAAAASWVATAWGADGHMRVGLLTGQARSSMTMEMPAVMALGLFLATWTLMMVAMMFPAAAPVVLTFQRWTRQRGRSPTTTVAFVAGYLAVWSTVGAAFYGLILLLEEVVHLGESTAIRTAGALLAVAGAYQLSPLKTICLRQCRSPMTVIMQHAGRLAQGHLGPFRVGVAHGTFCLGCCWSLMVVLVLLGMMSLAWMATVAAVIFAEKVLPRGPAIGVAVGVVLLLAGAAVVLAPHTVHLLA